jgi:transcriptional regulatory protein RtcR
MGRAARSIYLKYAHSEQATWAANFRDLNASVRRMATLCKDGKISQLDVEAEIKRLNKRWQSQEEDEGIALEDYLTAEAVDKIDLFDRLQLCEVIAVCQKCSNMAEAGRTLFNVSRTTKTSSNDSNRLRVYLQKFGLSFAELSNA